MLVTYRIESTSNWLRLINLSAKRAGERSAGNLHAPFDVAGDGKQLTVRLVRHSQRKRGAPDRSDLRSMAPFLDPTRGDPARFGVFSTVTFACAGSLSPTPQRNCSRHRLKNSEKTKLKCVVLTFLHLFPAGSCSGTATRQSTSLPPDWTFFAR